MDPGRLGSMYDVAQMPVAYTQTHTKACGYVMVRCKLVRLKSEPR